MGYGPLHHRVRHDWSNLALGQQKVWWKEVPELIWCIHEVRKDLRAFFSHSAIQFVFSPDGGAISCLQLKVPVLNDGGQAEKKTEGGKQTFFKKCFPRSLWNTYILISLFKIGQHACPSDISLTKGLRSPWWMCLPAQHQGTFGREGRRVISGWEANSVCHRK